MFTDINGDKAIKKTTVGKKKQPVTPSRTTTATPKTGKKKPPSDKPGICVILNIFNKYTTYTNKY